MEITKTPISSPKDLNEASSYGATFSRGTKITLGNFHLLVISGTASINEKGETVHRGDFEQQCKKTFENLTGLLESAGADWSKVIKTTIFLRDIDRDYETFCRLRKEFYDSLEIDFYPASTCVEAKICRSDLLLEIEMWAMA